MNRAATGASARHDTGGTFELVASENGRFTARGMLTFATARQAREQGLRSLASAAGRELEVDCAGITASDSAGLAVLLDWLGATKRAGRALRYTQLPGGLLALARISEVEELLERGVQVP
jgi:phospholipid transport system transporter-binding protein